MPPPAPWVRTRLRATPLSALLGAALAFVAVLLAAALPRAMDRGTDQALRSFLESRGPGQTSLYVTARPRYGEESAQDLDEVLATLVSRTAPGFAVAPAGPVHGSSASPRSLANRGLAAPDGVPPQLGLHHLRTASEHVRLVEGQWPGAPAPAPGSPIPIVMSQSAAKTIGIRVGMVLESATGRALTTMKAEVVGLYVANDDAEDYWTDFTCLLRACLNMTTTQPPQAFWRTEALVGAEALDPLPEWGDGDSKDFWRIPVDTGTLRADQLPATAKAVASYLSGPTAARLTQETRRSDLRFTSRLPEQFTYLSAIGGAVGDLVPVKLDDVTLPVRVTAAIGTLPVAGDTAIAIDLDTAARLLAAGGRELPTPGEWWLPAASADDPAPARAAAELRSGAGSQQVRLREEVAATLLDDPLSAGPQGALAALAAACAVLAAIGFAASAAAAARERAREFSVLTALGARRRDLARTATAESCLLVGLGTAVGVGLGVVIVHLVVPLTVLTPAAGRPEPGVLVDLPAVRILLLAAAIAAVPLLSAVFGGRRNQNRSKPADRLRHVEDI
ncbi:FtsX-like permease family protein [Streptomyces sp. NPDC002812]|uniref:FtsX-like permease family protein n=1 Tax=Streptomyces sp. NPDC002812 TaxID=3154434 RepID=UPI00332BEA09